MSTFSKTNSICLAGLLAILTALMITGCPNGQDAPAFNPFATQQQQAVQEAAQAPIAPVPALSALPLYVDTGDASIDPDRPVHDQHGQSLASRTVMFPGDSAGLQAEQDAAGPNWVLYAIGGLSPEMPPSGLMMSFSDLSGRIGVGLADFVQGNWVWEQVELPGEQIITIPGAQMVRSDGSLFVLLAVTPGNAASFNGGEAIDAEFLSEEELAAITLKDSEPDIIPADEPAAIAEEQTPATIETPVNQPESVPAIDYELFELETIRGELVDRVNFKSLELADAPRKAQSSFPIIDPLKPARDDAGWPMSSGAARFDGGVAKLRSKASLKRELEWVLYAVGGQKTTDAPRSIRLDFPEVTGQAWIGIPNYNTSSWDWRYIERSGRVVIDFGDQQVLNEQGILSFIVGVTNGDEAIFAGGELPGQSAPSIVGVYLSTGYWNADAAEATFARLESLGVNFVIDYALEDPTGDEASAALDAYLGSATKHGIGVAFPVDGPLAGMSPTSGEQQMNAAVALVAKLKNREGITAWYIHDEVLPMLAGVDGTEDYSISLAQMKSLYTRISVEDPDRPQLNVWSQIPTRDLFLSLYGGDEDEENYNMPYGSEPWVDGRSSFETAMRAMVQETCDWVLLDSYPVGAPWLTAGKDPADAVSDMVRRVARLRTVDQPVYFVFQAFSHAQYGEATAEAAPFPTAAEQNTMLTAAWRAGASGAIAYSWFDLHGSAPGRDIPGQAQCAADLEGVLSGLSSEGWPEP